MKYLLTLFSTLAYLQILFAQVQVAGVVRDATTMDPIPYVAVMLKESYIGTNSAEDGSFSFEIGAVDSPWILFKMIGYGDQEILLSSLNKNGGEVLLTKQEHELNEVVLRPVNAYDLLQQVVRAIPDNYYAKPIGQEVFFRQTMHTNGELNILEEGHFDIVNPFRKEKLPKSVTMHKARAFADLDVYADLGKILANNLDDDSINMIETAQIVTAFNPSQKALMEEKQSVFSDQASKFYNVVYQGLTQKDGHVCHIVSFDQKEGLKKTLFKGVLYIDTASLAIKEFKVGLSPEGVDFQKFLPLKVRLLIRLAGYKIGIKEVYAEGKYSFYDGYWVVKQGGFQLDGSIAKGKGAVLNGSLHLAYYVDHNFPKSSFYNRNSPYDIIASDLTPFKDLNFWDSQDVFRPSWSSYIQKLLDKKLTGL